MPIFLAHESSGFVIGDFLIACPCGDIVGFIRAVCGGAIVDDVEHSRFLSLRGVLVCYS